MSYYEALKDISFSFKNYKCFDDTEQIFECIKPFNLIIGRNNIGKSSLIDIIENIAKNNFEIDPTLYNNNQTTAFFIQKKLTDAEIKKKFSTGAHSLYTTHNNEFVTNDRAFGNQFIGKRLKYQLSAREPESTVQIDELNHLSDIYQTYAPELNSKFYGIIDNKLKNRTIIRLFADRNIVPEKHDNKLKLESNGDGATNFIQSFLNNKKLPPKKVRKEMLEALNFIYKGDSEFIDIACRRDENEHWEIYLEESKGLIALSKSGSGLKTVLLVLICLILIPTQQKKERELNDYIFAFEELENNLHPYIVRRLLCYLKDIIYENKSILFLTTHSNVMIDFFSKNKEAQIIHVYKNGDSSNCRTIKDFNEHNFVLDELGIKASDLLQANGIIWVEGPSDRTYVNKWIQIISGRRYREGVHYQCVFYGGKLLSHLDADVPDGEGLHILSVNRNSAIIIDSDKKAKNAPINKTKKRIKEEMKKNGYFCWITKGKEIENYLHTDCLKHLLRHEITTEVQQYEDFFTYLDNIQSGIGSDYKGKKPRLAAQVEPKINDSCMDVLDLREQVSKLCECIEKWNS